MSETRVAHLVALLHLENIQLTAYVPASQNKMNRPSPVPLPSTFL